MIASAGDLTLHLAHIQKKREVVVMINPTIEDYSDRTLTLGFERSTRFKIFDVHARTVHRFAVDGKNYEIEFLTWSKPDADNLRFEFEVRHE